MNIIISSSSFCGSNGSLLHRMIFVLDFVFFSYSYLDCFFLFFSFSYSFLFDQQPHFFPTFLRVSLLLLSTHFFAY